MTIIIYLACIGVAIYFCLEMWDKYNESPTMKSFASSQKTIGNIPFPAIAICPTNKVSKARLKERQSENPKYVLCYYSFSYELQRDRYIIYFDTGFVT